MVWDKSGMEQKVAEKVRSRWFGAGFEITKKIVHEFVHDFTIRAR